MVREVVGNIGAEGLSARSDGGGSRAGGGEAGEKIAEDIAGRGIIAVGVDVGDTVMGGNVANRIGGGGGK